MSDFALSRLNMVESQIRPSDVTDRRIMRAMLALAREAFVPQRLRPVCYMDQDLILPPSRPEAERRFLLAPRVLAKMVQALNVPDDGVVLDIGCATGYSTALLSDMARRVIAIESDGALADSATETLRALEIENARVISGALQDGAVDEAPFDAILINGAVADVPEALLDQLKDGGRLVAVRNGDGLGKVTQWLRVGSRFAASSIFDAAAPTLSAFAREKGFVF